MTNQLRRCMTDALKSSHDTRIKFVNLITDRGIFNRDNTHELKITNKLRQHYLINQFMRQD